jgi:hypothetical protein
MLTFRALQSSRFAMASTFAIDHVILGCGGVFGESPRRADARFLPWCTDLFLASLNHSICEGLSTNVVIVEISIGHSLNDTGGSRAKIVHVRTPQRLLYNFAVALHFMRVHARQWRRDGEISHREQDVESRPSKLSI